MFEKGKKVICIVLYTGIIALLSYLSGYDRGGKQGLLQTETFYGRVIENTEDRMKVEGMEINDVNYRGEFVLAIDESTEFIWRSVELPRERLQKGDRVSVTFTGPVLETSPCQIQEVISVQLLEDEK